MILNTRYKILILILIHLILSLISNIYDLKSIIIIFPFFYGIMFGIFYKDNRSKKNLGIIPLGILFVFVFIVSSFLGIYFSKLLFKSDDFTPLFSTPFSIFSLLFLLKTGFSFKSLIPTAITAIVGGLISTFLTMSEWGIEKNTLLTKTLFDVSFLWQTITGIVIIIGLDRLIQTKQLQY
jgi:hypothetical protein